MSLISVNITTPPASEPVTAAEVKLFSKIDFTDDDTLIDLQISSARQMVEKWLNKALITQTIKCYFNNYNNRVYLPYAPHQTITSVIRKRKNESKTLTENTDYYIIGDTVKYLDLEPSGIINPQGVSRNETLTAWNLEVTFTAGYGTSASDVPSPIKEAILRIIETNYDNRGDVTEKTNDLIPNHAKALISSYRTPTL